MILKDEPVPTDQVFFFTIDFSLQMMSIQNKGGKRIILWKYQQMMKLAGQSYNGKVLRIRNECGDPVPEAALIPKPEKTNFYQDGKKLPKKNWINEEM